MIPYQENLIHYNWHWWYNFGNGDAGSRGVHQLDIALWGMKIKTHPTRICGFGEKLYFDDDKQYPDTHYVTFEYPGDDAFGSKRLVVYEQRLWSPYWGKEDCEDGCTFYGDEGYLTVDMHQGWKLYGPQEQVAQRGQAILRYGRALRRFPTTRFATTGVRARTSRSDTTRLHYPHLTNILARTGRGQLTFDPQAERFVDAPDANALVGRSYREGHWANLDDV